MWHHKKCGNCFTPSLFFPLSYSAHTVIVLLFNLPNCLPFLLYSEDTQLRRISDRVAPNRWHFRRVPAKFFGAEIPTLGRSC